MKELSKPRPQPPFCHSETFMNLSEGEHSWRSEREREREREKEREQERKRERKKLSE